MPAPPPLDSYDYAFIRVVPHVERGEFVNMGVIVFCRTKAFLDARIVADEGRLGAIHPDGDMAVLRRHLRQIPRICAGDPDAGPIAALPQAERFHWLVAPRSTVIQTSPVHCGLCADPAAALEQLAGEVGA